MAWQENLFSNLLVVSILAILFAIIYCRYKGVTMFELLKSIKEGYNQL